MNLEYYPFVENRSNQNFGYVGIKLGYLMNLFNFVNQPSTDPKKIERRNLDTLL